MQAGTGAIQFRLNRVQTTPANGRLSPLRGENLVRLGLLPVWALAVATDGAFLTKA